MIQFKKGQLVLDPHCRVGMINEVANGQAMVKYGADGPHKLFSVRSLRFATKTEIRWAGLDKIEYVSSPASDVENDPESVEVTRGSD